MRRFLKVRGKLESWNHSCREKEGMMEEAIPCDDEDEDHLTCND